MILLGCNYDYMVKTFSVTKDRKFFLLIKFKPDMQCSQLVRVYQLFNFISHCELVSKSLTGYSYI